MFLPKQIAKRYFNRGMYLGQIGNSLLCPFFSGLMTKDCQLAVVSLMEYYWNLHRDTQNILQIVLLARARLPKIKIVKNP